MQSELVEKVSSKRSSKSGLKIFLICLTVICISFLIIALISGSSLADLRRSSGLSVILCFTSFWALLRADKDKNEQYFELWTDKVIYRTKNDEKVYEVLFSTIHSLIIGIDNIRIITKSNEKYIIYLEDYPTYKLRLRIKNIFENLDYKKLSMN